MGTGAFGSVEEACDSVIEVVGKESTNAETAKLYEKCYPLYGALYKHLKGDFDEIQQLIG